MSAHDHEADMAGPHWDRRIVARRRVGDTITYALNRHAQGWRDQQPANDSLATGREVFATLAAAAAVWIIAAALLAWLLDLLAA